MIDTAVYTIFDGASSIGTYENRVEHIGKPDAQNRRWLIQTLAIS